MINQIQSQKITRSKYCGTLRLEVQTDHAIPAVRPDIILVDKNNRTATRIYIDVVIPADKNSVEKIKICRNTRT
jgi:hypothetical protein